jgi:shikimate dehydrogenase
MLSIDADTGLCGVIGHPVGHSLSPHLHNAAFEAAGLNYVYLAFDVVDVGPFLGGMRAAPSFRGLSVTIPHKLAVIPYLDSLDPLAAKIGSVNTVTNDGGKLIGSTTDGLGALRAFEQKGVDLAGRRVLFLGSGGAVRAVAFTLAERCHPAAITILGRTETKVRRLTEDLRAVTRAPVAPGNLPDDLAKAMSEHEIVIQGTPVGMGKEQDGSSGVPREIIRSEHVVFDMVYRPHRTQLLADAEAAGAQVIYGIEMLIQQAALQFERWVGVAAPIGAMRAAARAQLGD